MVRGRAWMVSIGLVQMADDEHAAIDAVPRFVQEYIGQLRAATERFRDLSLIHISEPTRPY